jgi:rSAM/selenodomain-associated transferase 2
MNQPTSIAVVVPVLGDSQPLSRLLSRIAAWRDPAIGIFVVAGDDDPGTLAVCDQTGATYLRTQPCRGRQLDAGARDAEADILWFLHADATPDAGATQAIRDAVGSGHLGGCFRFTFTGQPSAGKRLLAGAINGRARVGIPYGDQGLFATRSAYLDAGGFPHQPLFEEVVLVKRLRHMGSFAHLAVPIGVDPRRWERDGFLMRTLHNRWLALRYALGAAPNRLAASYPQPVRTKSHG